MNIGIIGSSGNIGQRIVAEARQRGHRVTALVRDPARVAAAPGDGLERRRADVLDAASLERALDDLDVLVSAFGPGNAARDFDDVVRRAIAAPEVYPQAARALVTALAARRPGLRLIVVGGAGSLEQRPGVALVDAPDELGRALDSLGLPRDYGAVVAAHRDALTVLRLSNRNWTYLSPAEHIAPGERTGRFRLGGDQPVRDADGRSRISYEDFAVALVDEIELPRHVQRRFTVGY